MEKFKNFMQTEAQNVKNVFKNGDYISEWSNIIDKITTNILIYVKTEKSHLTEQHVLIFFKLFVYFRFISKFLRYPKDKFSKIIDINVTSLRDKYIKEFNERYKITDDDKKKYVSAYNNVIGFLKEGNCFMNLLQPLAPAKNLVASKLNRPPNRPPNSNTRDLIDFSSN